jgi:allophanate hydrolase
VTPSGGPSTTEERGDDLGLHALRSAYTRGLVDPADTVERVLARLAADGDDGVWIQRVDDDALRARARELAAIPDGASRLPLYGVPFAVKDNIDVAGLPTTVACPAYAYLATTTAPCAQALLDAGALLVGKTNLDQFATGLTGTRSPYGIPRHPVDPAWIPGGSSSGSAVAVANGSVSLTLGTDTAGSGRVPAALCGVVGYKPAPGWSSTAGIVPASPSFDCVSIFAGTVGDAEMAARVVRGGRSAPAAEGELSPGGRFRLAIPDPASLEVARDRGFAAAWDEAVGLLARLGPLSAIELEDFFTAGALLYDDALLAERYQAVGAFIEEHAEEVLPVTREVVLGGGRFTPEEVLAAQQRLGRLRARTGALWDQVDALVVPTVPTTFTVTEIEAEPIAHNATLGRYCQFVNLFGLAAIAVPATETRSGLPFGVTVVGPPAHEARLVAIARGIERDRSGSQS